MLPPEAALYQIVVSLVETPDAVKIIFFPKQAVSFKIEMFGWPLV